MPKTPKTVSDPSRQPISSVLFFNQIGAPHLLNKVQCNWWIQLKRGFPLDLVFEHVWARRAGRMRTGRPYTRSIAVASKIDPKSPSSVVNKISGRRVSRAAERTRQTVSIELRNLIYSCSYEIFFSLFFSALPFFHSWSISLLYFSKLSTCVSRRDGVECQRKRTVAIRLTSSSPEAKHGVYWTHAQTHERWDSCRCKRQCCRSKEKTSEEKICLFFLRYYISVTERRKRKQREKKPK